MNLMQCYDDIAEQMGRAPPVLDLDEQNRTLELLLTSCLNQGYVERVLGSRDQDTRLLLAALLSYMPKVAYPADGVPSTAMAWTDGMAVRMNPRYVWSAMQYEYPTLGRFPLTTWERELSGTLIHESAHLFLNHPARLKRMIDAAEFPRDLLYKVFNMVADVQVEGIAGRAIPDFTGTVAGPDAAKQLDLAPDVTSDLMAGSLLVEVVVRDVLKKMDPNAAPEPMMGGVVMPADDAEESEQKGRVTVAAAGEVAGVLGSSLSEQFKIPKPVRTLADALVMAMTEVANARSMQSLHPPMRNNGVCLPGRKPMPGRLVIAVDTSGSMSGAEIELALSQIAGVAESSEAAREILIFSFDAEISPITRIEPGQVFESFEATGRGGTSFNRAVANIMKIDEEEPVTAAVVITDGFGKCSLEPKFPILWALTNNVPRNDLPGDVVFLMGGAS